VTVRLPGARTAPPTSTRTRFQTGAVKHGRKMVSQDSRIAGTVGWSVADSMRFCVIESVESSRPRRARVARYIGVTATPRDIRSWLRLMLTAMDDPIIQRIECFRCSRGTLHAERRNRGYTLYRARSGALVARLRPTGSDDRFEVLYWSLWKHRWASTGPFGRTVLSVDDALRFIAHDDIFWFRVIT
jgi:hypothetical protein